MDQDSRDGREMVQSLQHGEAVQLRGEGGATFAPPSCRVQVLPSPEKFFKSQQLWSDDEYLQMFLQVALKKWLGHLLEQAEELVPAARASQLVPRESRKGELHPLSLMQRLPGTEAAKEAAMRSLLEAKYRTRQLELEAKILRLFTDGGTQSLLSEAEAILSQENVVESERRRALELLRLADHFCHGRRRMLSFWDAKEMR